MQRNNGQPERPSGPVLEAVLRRDRLIFSAGLAVVVVVAAAWILTGAGMGMTAVGMTAGWSEMTGGIVMKPAVWTPAYALLMLVMWAVMMIAMMLPSASPLLLLYLKMVRNSHASAKPLAPAGLLALGYVLAWCGFSVLAVILQWVLEQARLLSPMLMASSVWLGAAILIAAGLWQLTPIKAVCLRHCRSPLAFLTSYWRPGHWGALRMGLAHGVYCLGCCWFLMALLFFGGVMNLFWIAGLAVYVLVEKTAPFGHWLGRAAGVALVGWGVWLLPV